MYTYTYITPSLAQMRDAFPALMHVLSSTDDAAALQNGCECLSAFLIGGAEQLTSAGAIEPIIQFVAMLLQLVCA